MAITKAVSTPHRSAVLHHHHSVDHRGEGRIHFRDFRMGRQSPTPTTAIATLGTNPSYATQESTGGVKVAMMELNWNSIRAPSRAFSTSPTKSRCRACYASLKAAGMRVTLGLGLHLPPAWVKSQPNATFVDQDGGVSTEANMVFNNNILVNWPRTTWPGRTRPCRSPISGQSESPPAVRARCCTRRAASTGLSTSTRRTARPCPPRMARNPFPGWRPGTTGLTTTQVTQWANWYVGALADTARWQATAIRGLGFTGDIQVVTPGIGVLNNKIAHPGRQQPARTAPSAPAPPGPALRQDGRHPQRRGLRLLRWPTGPRTTPAAPPPTPVHRPGTAAGTTNFSAAAWIRPDRRPVRLRQVRRKRRPARRHRPHPPRVLPRPVRPRA